MDIVRIALAAGLLVAAAEASAAGTAEPIAYETVWVDPMPVPHRILGLDLADAAGCRRVGRLSAPSPWQLGDAVGVILAPADDAVTAAMVAAPLAAGLLEGGASVLELASGGPCRQASPTGTAPGTPLMDLLGALRALHEEVGAGLILAIGLGAAGQAALEAARLAEADDGAMAAGPRLVAALALGDGTADIRRGGAPPPRERWSDRGPMLCALLRGIEARAAAISVPLPMPSFEACAVALLGPPPDPPAAPPPSPAIAAR